MIGTNPNTDAPIICNECAAAPDTPERSTWEKIVRTIKHDGPRTIAALPAGGASIQVSTKLSSIFSTFLSKIGLSSLNKVAAKKFAEGVIPNLSIKKGAQNKHVIGTNEFKIANLKMKRSTLSEGLDVQSLVNKYAGSTGKSVNSKPLGSAGSVERISTNKIIGNYFENGKLVGPTTNFTIKYSNSGVHIVPARPTK